MVRHLSISRENFVIDQKSAKTAIVFSGLTFVVHGTAHSYITDIATCNNYNIS